MKGLQEEGPGHPDEGKLLPSADSCRSIPQGLRSDSRASAFCLKRGTGRSPGNEEALPSLLGNRPGSGTSSSGKPWAAQLWCNHSASFLLCGRTMDGPRPTPSAAESVSLTFIPFTICEMDETVMKGSPSKKKIFSISNNTFLKCMLSVNEHSA